MAVRACGLSDPGRARKTNEDYFVSDEELGLFAVADGMGGHAAGEVASRLGIEAIEDFIRRSSGPEEFTWPYGIDPSLSYDANRVKTAIHLANRRVFREAESHDEYTGMGSTIVVALLAGDRLVVGHAGDSRLYVLEQGMLSALTRDDTWIATLLAGDPTLDPAALAQHPMRNVLTNVLGATERNDVHIAERRLVGGEMLLLCTDGLHREVADERIRDLMLAPGDLPAIARRLVQAALDAGGRDNVTVLLVSQDPGQ